MRLAFLLLPLITLAAVLDMRSAIVIDANIAHGFPYPLAGSTHVLVLFAVGLLASRYPGRRRWTLPIIFVLLFAVGLAGGMNAPGHLVHSVDLVLAGSLVFFGALALSGLRPPLALLGSIVAALACVHGFAHGVQVASSSNTMRVSREIVTAAAILLLAGTVAGALLRLIAHHGQNPARPEPAETPS